MFDRNKNKKVWNNNLKAEDFVNIVISELSCRYEKKLSDSGKQFFVFPDGTAGIVSCSDEKRVLWVEYADNQSEAKKDRFPWDGDGFFIDGSTPEEITIKIIKEVENWFWI